MQLVAYGAQDIYLTGNPQITFFKVVYRRHTNFSMETIQQTIAGSSTLGGSASSGDVTVSRNGDLLYKVYVTSNTPGIANGDNLIQEVDLEIGGQLIDRQSKEWMQIWEELSIPEGNKPVVKYMKHARHAPGTHDLVNTANHVAVGMVQIPLYFWFCRNPGLALPLIALQYHEVKLKFTWGVSTKIAAASNLHNTSVAGNANEASDCAAEVKVWCDYIYLDTDERRRFAQVSHEYLIEQIQVQTGASSKSNKLNFNHPVKELIWTYNYQTDEYGEATLDLNGHERFAPQEEEYFQLRQPHDYHTSIPSTNVQPEVRDLGGVLNFFTATATGTTLTGELTCKSTAKENLTLFMTGTRKGEFYPHIGDQYLFKYWDHSRAIVAATNDGWRVTNARVTAVTASGTTGTWAKGENGSDDAKCDTFVLTLATIGATDNGWWALTDGVRPGVAAVGVSDGIMITPISWGGITWSTVNSLTKSINCYSFALKPEEHQPSGTCNFSRIDTAKLNFTTAPTGNLSIYAVNYNVLRIMSGMGGLAYSN